LDGESLFSKNFRANNPQYLFRRWQVYHAGWVLSKKRVNEF
jgi:hypothetical protein